jgi:hypothetical protein
MTSDGPSARGSEKHCVSALSETPGAPNPAGGGGSSYSTLETAFNDGEKTCGNVGVEARVYVREEDEGPTKCTLGCRGKTPISPSKGCTIPDDEEEEEDEESYCVCVAVCTNGKAARGSRFNLFLLGISSSST